MNDLGVKNILKKLVIGAAGKEHPNAITVDIDPLHKPDVVHDLSKTPWPFDDNQFNEIVAHHVIEHIDDIEPVMSELHRVCAPNGEIYIEVPHHTSWCAKDPAHKAYYSYFSFDGFIEGAENSIWVTGPKFRRISQELHFHKAYRFLFQKLFNKFPMMYERHWCYIFPAEHLKLRLEPIK